MPRRVIRTAKAAARDRFCCVHADRERAQTSIFTDITDPWFDPDNILVVYDGTQRPPWWSQPLNHDVSSICRYTCPERDRTIFVLLSPEGEVAFGDPDGGFVEAIADAGLRRPAVAGHGMLSEIRQIGTRLHACGFGGQVYRRESPGEWRHIDAGLLNTERMVQSGLSGIAGPGEDHIYVVGHDGLVASFDGVAFSPIAVPTEHDLYAVLAESEESIWISGNWGTLLHGNRRTGFIDRSAETPRRLTSMALFQGTLFLGSDRGVHVRDGGEIVPLDTGLQPAISGGVIVDAADDVLWVFGGDSIARFDGRRWALHPIVPDQAFR